MTLAASSLKSFYNPLEGIVRLSRVGNLFIIITAQYFTAFCLLQSPDNLALIKGFELAFLSLSTILIAAGGYVINDYYDVKIDLINKPERVVIGRLLKRRVAMAMHVGLSLSGIALGLLLSWQIGLINMLVAVLLWWYSNYLKRTPFFGNLVVALLTGLSVYLVGFFFEPDNKFIIAYTAFAFSFTLIREIVKDIEDLKGDQVFGCHTLPVVIGLRNTKRVVYFLMFLIVVTVTIFTDIKDFKAMLLSGGLIMASGYFIFCLKSADTIRHFHQLSKTIKIIMLLGILSMTSYISL